MPSVGENVIRLRGLRGWDQGDLAERLSISQPSMWKIEKGTPKWWKVELGTLFKLAIALEVPIEDLVAGLNETYDKLRRDLPRHALIPPSAPQQGRADVPAAAAQARIRELTKTIEDRDAQLKAIERVARGLASIAADAEGRKAGKRTTRRSKGRRKAG